MGASSQITGISSGFDTQGIINGLMNIERVPYQKLDVKKQTAEVRRQAYQAVNSMLLKFKNSVSSLASPSLWKSKAATSTNESSLTATASQYAVNGSYALKVAQLAAAAQHLSKGFSSSKTAFKKVAEGKEPTALGTINLNSGKSRVDTSAKLESLNGGKGIYRGSIRVTDASNNSSIIDLSGCDTMDDVVQKLNESTGAQIKASIKDGRLYVEDDSGGKGAMKIQNMGSGTTATDLGIAGTAKSYADDYSDPALAGTTDKFIHGRNVYYMGEDTGLGLLQDGLGVEEGAIEFVFEKGGTSETVQVDLTDCSTVGDVISRVNSTLKAGGWGVELGVNADGNAFTLQGVSGINLDGFNVTVRDYRKDANQMFQPKTASQLGLEGSYAVSGNTLTFERVLGDVNSPMLKNLSGTGTGIGSATAAGTNKVPLEFNGDTLLKNLNDGKGVDFNNLFEIKFIEGNGSSMRQTQGLIDKDALLARMAVLDGASQDDWTVDSLTKALNEQIQAYADNPDNYASALKGMEIAIGENGLYWDGLKASNSYGVITTGKSGVGLGESLGLLRSSITAADSEKVDLGTLYEVKDMVSGLGNANSQMEATGFKTIGDLLSDTQRIKQQQKKDGNGDLMFEADGTTPIMEDVLDENNQPVYENQSIRDAGDIAALIGAGSFEITIGGNSIDLATALQAAVTAGDIDDDTEIQKVLDVINKAIGDEMAADPAMAGKEVPILTIDLKGKGFTWNNIDPEVSFKAEGTLAEAFGLDKDFAGLSGTNEIADTVQQNLNPTAEGYYKPVDFNATNIEEITLSELYARQGMDRWGEDTDTIVLKYGAVGQEREVTVTKADLKDYLQTEYGKDFNTATVKEYVTALNKVINKAIETQLTATPDPNDGTTVGNAMVEFVVSNDGIVLKKANSPKDGEYIVLEGSLVKNGGAGLQEAQFFGSSSELDPPQLMMDLDPWIVQEQELEGLGSIFIEINGTEYELKTDGLDGNSTLADLMDKLNSEIDRQVTFDNVDETIRFTVNSSGTGLALDNQSSKKVEFTYHNDNNVIGRDLGFINNEGEGATVKAYSVHNSDSLGRKYFGRATTLASLNGGEGIIPGSISLTNAYGATMTLDLTEAKTVGDVLDGINSLGGSFGIQAMLNATGDGIVIVEGFSNPDDVPDTDPTGNIRITDLNGGNLAKSLKIAGEGTRNKDMMSGLSTINGSQKTTIEVMENDTLESLMYRIAESGDYKCAIINDGSSTNPYRLTISSARTGEASDFVIDSDMADFFGFNQTSRGKDSKVLYGDPNSAASSVMLSSSTNSNSNAILGLTLDLKQTTENYTIINVDTDKTKVVEEIKNMVQTYNDLNDLVSYLDAPDEETGEKGILSGDSNIRKLMEDINDMFYLVFNPDNMAYADANKYAETTGKQATWSWMDLGISLSAKNSQADGSGSWYSTMDCDLDKLDEMVASNWDQLYEMMAGQRNASNSKLADTVKATSTFNGTVANGYSADNAINGDTNKSNFGTNNGILANDTIANGANEYTIWFQKPTTLSRLSIYHESTDTALKNFTVEYMDPNTGKWETLREISNNSVDANHLGFPMPTEVTALRITAKSTNATDGKFRLLDVQAMEDIGLAGQLNNLTTALGDTTSGWLRTMSDEIDDLVADLDDQMLRLDERLTLKEQALWRQFNAMESALGSLQSQSNYLDSIFSSMNSSSKK